MYSSFNVKWRIKIGWSEYCGLQKAKKVWHEEWSDCSFTVQVPDETFSDGEVTRYVQMIQTHGSVQLSYGVSTIPGLLDLDTKFKIERVANQPTTLISVKDIIRAMTLEDKKIWHCISRNPNGSFSGYFLSIFPAMQRHVS